MVLTYKDGFYYFYNYFVYNEIGKLDFNNEKTYCMLRRL